MSYRGVLSRGFALVRDETQRPLRRAEEVRQAQRLEIEFADGKVGADSGRARRAAPHSARAIAAPAAKTGQGRRAGVALLTAFAGARFSSHPLLDRNPKRLSGW